MPLPKPSIPILPTALLSLFLAVSSAHSADSSLTFDSSNSKLVDGFNFAKPTALGYVQTGKAPGYIPCYWAGGTDRKAFYARDSAHQLAGAHLLGLDLENRTMVQKFAGSATPSRRFYPLWSIGFDGTPYATDYKSDTDFVRELPMPFDLLRRAYEQYLWTGNSWWINDPILSSFYYKTTHEFLKLHEDQNHVATESGSTNIFQGVASYNEQGEGLTQAGDAIGSEYQAFLAYSDIQRARWDLRGALESGDFADLLMAFFNQNWYSTSAETYIRGYDAAGQSFTNWGKENSFFMPLTLITLPGPRTSAFLDYIDQQMANANGEAQSYLPELYYSWGEPDTAEKWLLTVITNPGGTTTPGARSYPEFSFTYISGLIGGLLGVEPNAPANRITTLNNLPADTQWASGDHIPVGTHDLFVRQERGTVMKTTVHINSGENLDWEAGFYGNFPSILVNGVETQTHAKQVKGVVIQVVEVHLPAGGSATVQTPGNAMSSR
jgi:hypothetical protein